MNPRLRPRPEWFDIVKVCGDEEDIFIKGLGTYHFTVTRFKGQYDGLGRCEFPPYWELTEIGFDPMPQQEGAANAAE